MDKIRTIRIVIGDLFRSPVARMNFPAYFNYINTAGKLTPRTLMEVEAVILTFIEEQEKINLQNEENFKQIFDILFKLVKNEVKLEAKPAQDSPKTAEIEEGGTTLPETEDPRHFIKTETEKELLRLKRIENLKKAREARKAKIKSTI